jgi:hypothetical protein
MESKPINRRLAVQLHQNWGLQNSDIFSRDELYWLLVQQMEWMVSHDMERLVQSMYRLDVNENDFHLAMQAVDSEVRAQNLARIVLEREQLRAETWVKYSSPHAESHD